MPNDLTDSDFGVQRKEFESLRLEIERELGSCRDMATENKGAIVRLETLYESLSKLPDSLDSLKGAVLELNKNVEIVRYRIEETQENVKLHEDTLGALQDKDKEIDEHISELDNKSKIDWQLAVTRNFWPILAVLGILYLTVKDFLS